MEIGFVFCRRLCHSAYGGGFGYLAPFGLDTPTRLRYRRWQYAQLPRLCACTHTPGRFRRTARGSLPLFAQSFAISQGNSHIGVRNDACVAANARRDRRFLADPLNRGLDRLFSIERFQEFGEVLDGADHADKDAQYEEDKPDPMEIHRRFEPKELYRVSVVDEQTDETNELKRRFELSARAGRDDESLADGDLSQSLDGEFSRQNDDGNPRGDPSHGGELYGRRHDHELIGKRVEEFSRDGYEIESSREISIEKIGDGCDRKSDDGQETVKGRLHGKTDDDERDENDAAHRDRVGEIEEIALDR